MKWLFDLLADFHDKLAERRTLDKLDAMREEERQMSAHIKKLRREHFALCDQIRYLETEILKGVRL